MEMRKFKVVLQPFVDSDLTTERVVRGIDAEDAKKVVSSLYPKWQIVSIDEQ